MNRLVTRNHAPAMVERIKHWHGWASIVGYNRATQRTITLSVSCPTQGHPLTLSHYIRLKQIGVQL